MAASAHGDHEQKVRLHFRRTEETQREEYEPPAGKCEAKESA